MMRDLLPVRALRRIEAGLRLGLADARARRRLGAESPTVVGDPRPWTGGPVAIVALFQAGPLRPDTSRLLAGLKRSGAYTVTVATAGDGRTGADLALLRANYGRDFGSYRQGVLHLAEEGWLARLPRLLLVNDSVFVTSRGLDAFLAAMLARMPPAPPVLGAVSSVEIAPHLPSFAVSLGAGVVADPGYVAFWRNYRPSDLRRHTVARGELGLSAWLAARAPLQAIHAATGQGNPMHDDPAGLIAQGLPLVKLDGVYRGRFDGQALDRICAALPDAEGREFRALATTRPPGLGSLTGWQREAFRAGMI